MDWLHFLELLFPPTEECLYIAVVSPSQGEKWGTVQGLNPRDSFPSRTASKKGKCLLLLATSVGSFLGSITAATADYYIACIQKALNKYVSRQWKNHFPLECQAVKV